LRRSKSGAAGNGPGNTAKNLRGAAAIGLGTTIIYLRRTASSAANNGVGTTINYLANQNVGAGSDLAKTHYTKARHENC
jgi:hypothetical protein